MSIFGALKSNREIISLFGSDGVPVTGNHAAEVRSLSLENPATPLSAPADWLFETLSGGFGLDGQLWVNERTAMQLSTVWACVRAISQDIASVPLNLYKKDAKGNKTLADNRVEYQLLQKRPNPHMTAMVFRQATVANVLLWGNGYAAIPYNGAGKINALWPMYPQTVRIELMPSGTLRYVQYNPNTEEHQVLLSDDILHFKDINVDGYVGLYTIRHLREAVGLGLALQNFGLYYFLNGSRPGGVLEMPGTLTPDAQERLRQSWRDVYTGTRNANKVAVLEQGMKFNPIGIPNDSAQYVESRNLQAVEIARIFRVPPHKIGILERATNNNIEQQALEYTTDCLRPLCVMIEQELNAKMFPGGDFEYEHDMDGLLRGDFASVMAGLASGRQWGYLSANDARRKLNMNDIGPEGDIYLTPLNMTDAKNDPAPVVTPPAPPKDDAVDPVAEPKRGLTKEEIKIFTVGLFEDAVRRSLNYDRNAQLRKSMSRAFTKTLAQIALMRGHAEKAESAARTYADELYLRRDEWEGQEISTIVDGEFDIAYDAMELKESIQ